ncbi:hypothetical protein [Viridibacillus arvi]|uniref:hypothetical protein n=1 Tax=Viridibacillus arvi TaxID=263475 RepID=UPI0036E3F8B2
MGKHNLKFVKPLTSVMLGVAVLTSTIAVQPDTAEAASSSNYKVNKGNLVSKTTGKIVKGTKTYKGKIYKNGKFLNGLKAGVFYKKGKKATGTYKGKYYSKGKIFTGLKAGIYYKAGAKATGSYQGKYFSKGKVFTGLISGVYYKKGMTGTGMYQGEYYSKGSLFSGLIDGVYYEKGSKATGVYNGNYYENGILFTGLQINTGYLYINGVLNNGLRLLNGNLYKGAILNDGVIQYDGKWYKGSSLASGTITTPDGKTITVDGGVEKPSSGSDSGGGYQSPLSIAINQAINALGALSYSNTNPINSLSKYDDARTQYDKANKAVQEAFNKGAVQENFGSILLKLEAQKTEINRYEKVLDDGKQAINKAKAQEISDLITAIDNTLETFKVDVDAARKAYNALTVTQKGFVEHLSELEDSEAAVEVIIIIEALNPNSTQAEIEAARAACDALTADQLKLVNNLSILEDAEAALNVKIDIEKAHKVIDLIAAFGPNLTEANLDDARTAYEGLTLKQRSLVNNYNELVHAETAFKESLRITNNLVKNATNPVSINIAQLAVTKLLNGKSKDDLHDKLNLAKAVIDASMLMPVYFINKTIFIATTGGMGSTVTWIFNGQPTEVKNGQISTEVIAGNTLEATVANNNQTVTVQFIAKEILGIIVFEKKMNSY